MRTTPRHARRVLASVAVAALVLAGCSNAESDDDDETNDASQTQAEETTASGDPTGDESQDDDSDDSGELLTGAGVTQEPCPEAVNEDNGCIYLGILSDLTEGPFAPLAVPITAAQEAFWNRVNEDGGIGGEFDVNVTEYTRDNKYNPEIHNQAYQEIKPDVLALAQTLGSPTTAAIIEDMIAEDIVGAPASWTSLWETENPGTHILESGNNYCVESMNAIDYHLENVGEISKVLAVHLPGDYGEDGAAGAKMGAEANGLEFEHVEVPPGGSGTQLQGAVDAIVTGDPDLVITTLPPGQLGEVIGGAAAQQWQGAVYGNGPSWNGALLDSPAAPALEAMYTLVAPWPDFAADTPGHQAMRDALGDVEGNEGYTSGWAWSYPLLTALEEAHANGDLTREGLLAAVQDLETVDYEGMLPPEAGDFSGDANAQTFRGSSFARPDASTDSGVATVGDFYFGPTAAEADFSTACYQAVELD